MQFRPPSSSSSPSILPGFVQSLDRRVGGQVNRWHSSPRVDAALLRLSTAANNGLLWYVVAGALALQGPRGRRAAVRGLLSLGASSAFANLVAKPVFGGARPLAADIPLARQLAKFPASASFPSGHTASALAFASGAALESPASLALAGPLALGVAYSRLHVGAHWLSDVAGGALIGGGMAVLGRAVMPRLGRRRR